MDKCAAIWPLGSRICSVRNVPRKNPLSLLILKKIVIILIMNAEKMSRIELNSFGPFNHGVWENSTTGEKIGKEEFLSGRSRFIFSKFCEFMKTFTEDQIATMTVIDVGSYDGWFANEISKKYDFKKVVSSEPHQKTLIKVLRPGNF
jgi:hypothetical protein